MKRNKKGISLIVLVITIIIVIILAAVVVMTLSKNNPIESAKKANFLEDTRNFSDELSITFGNKMLNDGNYDLSKVNVPAGKTGSATDYEIQEYIPSMPDNYAKVFSIESGLLTLANNASSDQKEWAQGIVNISTPWNSPYKVDGCNHIDGTTVETGYAIRDQSNGSIYVWVPVKDISDFKRTDWGIGTPAYNTCTENMPQEIIDSISTYGGFYIAQTEARTTNGNKVFFPGPPVYKVDTGTTSKDDIVAIAANLYKDRADGVKSTLMYGSMYDTILNWFISSNAVTLDQVKVDSSSWGNYGNATSDNADPACIKNNIHDLVGNVWEMTLERCGDNGNEYVLRSGSIAQTGTNFPAGKRYSTGDLRTDFSNVGFRIALYKSI